MELMGINFVLNHLTCLSYHIFPKYLDWQAWANSVDWSDAAQCGLHCHSAKWYIYQQVAWEARSDVHQTGDQSDLEIFSTVISTVILSLSLIQEGQLSGSGKRMYWLTT